MVKPSLTDADPNRQVSWVFLWLQLVRGGKVDGVAFG
jgi:hypothetical protein